MPAFIPDGYTVSARLNAVKEIESDVIQFSYRPATGGEVSAWLQDRMRGDGKQFAEANAAHLASHLVSWSIKHAGKIVEITPANCSRLHPIILNRLCDIIAGYDKPDAIDGEEVPPTAAAVGN